MGFLEDATIRAWPAPHVPAYYDPMALPKRRNHSGNPEPKTETTGTPTAAAMCIGPLSLQTRKRHRESTARNSRRGSEIEIMFLLELRESRAFRFSKPKHLGAIAFRQFPGNF